MKFLKKAGALSSASALAGLAAFAGVVGVANAAPISLVIEPQILTPGHSTTITIEGCPVGSTLDLSQNGDSPLTVTVVEGDLPFTTEFTWDDFDPGTVIEFTATCTPSEGSDEAVSSANDSLTLFGASYVEAVPDEFVTGETVSITAGDFLPGTSVTLSVVPQGAEEAVYTSPFGTAGDDFSVKGDVVLPKDLECGAYLVQLQGGDEIVTAALDICGKPDKPSSSPSPTKSPSPSASSSPSSSLQPSATASPSRPTNPGLPATGN